jgi:hypothetical protein
MANTKISSLPTFTADTSGIYLVMDNSGLTETYKVSKEKLFEGYTTNVISPVTGSWTLLPGSNNVSFSVPGGHTYSMWVLGNIPNGICSWNATATVSNTNVPVVGSQYAWYYSSGNALVFTSIPDQFTGTNNTIISTPISYVSNTSNVFNFGITNNSGVSQIINYGYIRLS